MVKGWGIGRQVAFPSSIEMLVSHMYIFYRSRYSVSSTSPSFPKSSRRMYMFPTRPLVRRLPLWFFVRKTCSKTPLSLGTAGTCTNPVRFRLPCTCATRDVRALLRWRLNLLLTISLLLRTVLGRGFWFHLLLGCSTAHRANGV